MRVAIFQGGYDSEAGSLVYHLVPRSIEDLFPAYRADSLLERTSYITTSENEDIQWVGLYHGSTLLGSALQIACSLYIYPRMAGFMTNSERAQFEDMAENAPDNDSSSSWRRHPYWNWGLLLGAWGDQSACSRRSCENRP